MPLTKYGRKKLQDHALGLASWTMPSTVYLALFTGDPTLDGLTTTEPPGAGYARQVLTTRMAQTVLATGQAANNLAFTFGTATGNWGTLSHWGTMDALTGGNMIHYGPLLVAIYVGAGDSAPVPEGSIVFEAL